jgi:hypothetical protein
MSTPDQELVLTHFIVSDDVERSRRFYTDVLGGRVARSREPTNVALANSWIVINRGGGPTDDKPAWRSSTARGEPESVPSSIAAPVTSTVTSVLPRHSSCGFSCARRSGRRTSSV